ncbi:MAG: class I SAM-dependent methyltransferase [Verrucomicrobiota bacterium JB022]|nr:class I SAM-dependent methyltransferase [Verrucomicrobiota bacterium JB022]
MCPSLSSESQPAPIIIGDYPVVPRQRYTPEKPHPQIHQACLDVRGEILELLRSFQAYEQELLSVPTEPQADAPQQFAWNNGFLAFLDAMGLYGFLAQQKPRNYLEIGSGNSTRLAHAARQKHSPHTRITSIDPFPRAEIDALCDEVIRAPLEETDLKWIERLDAGDILFFDGSHRVFQNSDVEVFFLEVLPRLRPGVLVQVHDIFWPIDYPQGIMDRFYSEQYMLGMLIAFAPEKIRIRLPNTFISLNEALEPHFPRLLGGGNVPREHWHGCSFWFEWLG